MKINEFIEECQKRDSSFKCFHKSKNEGSVDNVYVSDLLSMVMANAKANQLWMTVQKHVNAIAVAELLDLGAILLVEGVVPDETALTKAIDNDITILGSEKDAYALTQIMSQVLK